MSSLTLTPEQSLRSAADRLTAKDDDEEDDAARCDPLPTEPSQSQSQAQQQQQQQRHQQQQTGPKDSTPSSSHIIPPPSEFRGSPGLSSENTSSTTSSLTGEHRHQRMYVTADGQYATYDIMTGLDGADLRFMDESSVIVPSPSYESPPSSFSCSLANPLSTTPSSPILGGSAAAAAAAGTSAANTSLLQAALIRATAQQVADKQTGQR